MAPERGGSIGMWPIAPGNFETWKRKGGLFLTEIFTNNGNSYKFYTKKNKIYNFTSDCQLFNAKTQEKIQPTNEPFNLNIQIDIKPLNVLNSYVRLHNSYHEPIFVRLQAKIGFGTEDLFEIEPDTVYEWKRTPGKFLMEINTDDETGNYYVVTDREYTCTETQLIDNQTGQEVPICDDEFPDMSIKPSKYQEEIIEKQKADKKPYQPKINNNFVEDNAETAPWWQGIKPNYQKGQKFTDHAFPPEKHTILGTDKQGKDLKPHFMHAEKELLDTKGMKFKRIPEIFGNTFHLFQDLIECRDIAQGQIGDCWFMSSVASLATRPELIQKVFKTKSANPEGYYELFFYHDGVKYTMFLDDYIVTKNGKSVFANPNGNEIWVILLEKLLAKYEGGYNNIDGGFCSDALTFLTGAVTQHFPNPKNKWREICSAIQRRNIVTCGTYCKKGYTDKDDRDGICYGHAYSVIDAREYSGQEGNFKLIKLRNPWGQGEWNGKWSDSDKRWTPQLKQFFNFTEGIRDDGLFYMEFSDFCEYYEEVDICTC